MVQETSSAGNSAATAPTRDRPVATVTTGAAGTGKRLIPAGQSVPGVTDSTIEVGLWHYDTEALGAAVGVLGGPSDYDPSEVDPTRGARAVAEWVNANGGIAGRQLVIRVHRADVSEQLTNSGSDRAAQRACAFFTEDHHVFAMMAMERGGNLECGLASNTVVLHNIWPIRGWLSASLVDRYHDIWYGPNWLTAERRDRTMVESLWESGLLTPTSKVGVLIEDTTASRESADNAVMPALQARGIDPVSTIHYGERFNSPWENYILQLRADGADTVLFSANTGNIWPPLFMMRAAENQQYRPRWGIASDQGPYYLGWAGAPTSQLANAQAMGWSPFFDVFDQEPQSSNSEICRKIDADAGGNSGAAFFCEELFFLKFVLDQSSEVSPAGLSAALGAVGNRFPSMATIGGATALTPEHHDGVAVYRPVGYDEHCNEDGHPCFKYIGPPREMAR